MKKQKVCNKKGEKIREKMKRSIAMLCLAMLLCSAFYGIFTAAGGVTAAATAEKCIKIEGGDYGYPTPFALFPKGPGYIRMSFIFDTLTWKDKDGVIPWLADSWSRSYDAKVWTFYLQPEVKWSDGEPFTADDVKFTFDYTNEHPQLWYAYNAKEIDHVEVLDPYTVRIHLKKSRPTYIEDVAGCVPMIPEHIWSYVDDPYTFRGDDAVIGTGPLKLVEYDGTQGYYEYEANTNCFKGEPLIDRLIMLDVGDAALALKAGDIDAASFMGKEIVAVEEFEDDPDFEIEEGSSWWVLKFCFNLMMHPMNDTDFRRAIAYGINRADIVQTVTHGGSILANTGIIHPDSTWYKPGLPAYGYDPTVANEILNDLNFTDSDGDGIREYKSKEGNTTALKFTLITSEEYTDEAEFIKDDLKDLGIDIGVKSVSRRELSSGIACGKFEFAISGHGGIVNPRVLEWAAEGTSLNEEYNEKYEKQLRIMDEEDRKELVGDLQTIIAEEVPVYPLYHPNIWRIYDPDKLDTWFYTKDAIAGSIPLALNKLIFLFDPWRYDANEDGIIDKSEVIDAIQDYFDSKITKEQEIEVVKLYFL
jgi:peptide/nickel transport system substrate-binding protein